MKRNEIKPLEAVDISRKDSLPLAPKSTLQFQEGGARGRDPAGQATELGEMPPLVPSCLSLPVTPEQRQHTQQPLQAPAVERQVPGLPKQSHAARLWALLGEPALVLIA